jgi:cyclic-di-GMP-binding protein
MPSMDVISEINLEEVKNAAENANRELATRYDFRGADASFEWKSPTVTMKGDSDFQIKQMSDVLRGQLVKRKIDAKALTLGSMESSGRNFKQVATFKEGIEQPIAKKVVKMIKDSKLKVQAAIQGEKLRITGKKRDDLQAVMKLIREADLEQSFQFDNFKD